MSALLMLLALLAGAPAAAAGGSSLEATIRGTAEPLAVDLLVRGEGDAWTKIAHRNVSSESRNVRFDGLGAGVYQLLVRGPQPSQQLATKVILGSRDDRRVAIDVEPVELTGRMTLGGTPLGMGALFLQHKELRWRGGIALADDGSFRVPLWQTGEFTYSVRAPVLATTFTDTVTLNGASPIRFAVDIPDGRIAGIVRDAKSGAPVPGAVVALQTDVGDEEQHVRLTTNAGGRFDFTGIKYGRQTVRIVSPVHLEPAPIVFELSAAARLREIDARLDAGRALALVVADAENDPAAKATVYAIAGTRLCSRATTDEDGRATIAIPEGEDATLFVVPAEGAFGAARVARDGAATSLRIDLPPPSSSLRIRAQTTDGGSMPAFSLLMRYNGALVPAEIAEALTAALGLRLGTGPESEVRLEKIPGGVYEFWPYRTLDEAEAIAATADAVEAPIHVNVRAGENTFTVKFAAR